MGLHFRRWNQGELIKTGDITSGTLTDGTLARASVVNQFYFANVTLNGTNTRHRSRLLGNLGG